MRRSADCCPTCCLRSAMRISPPSRWSACAPWLRERCCRNWTWGRTSADARAGLGAAVVKDVRHDLGRMAERLATLYKLPLDQRLRETLVERYGANAERLEMLATQVSEGGALPIRRVRAPEREQLLRDPRWALLLKLGERYLARNPSGVGPSQVLDSVEQNPHQRWIKGPWRANLPPRIRH